MMNYSQTIQFLYSQLPAYHRIGKAAYKNDLTDTIAFDEYLGHPHSGYKTIHVGGTNGKGSVSHMIASVLMNAGYKTGLYTSPHLTDFRERIRINGKMISRNAVTGFVKKHSEFISSLQPSFFEMTVAMAFNFFATEEVDVAVIEVGLGGRLDSTNIINPVLSVITNIGHDHMDLLGDTLEKVAVEKAGIIKRDVPVVISETSAFSEEVFKSKAKESHSEIFFADRNFRCIQDDFNYAKGTRAFTITDLLTEKQLKGEIPLGGDYQAKNLQGVFQACRILERNFCLQDENVLRGIRDVITNTSLKGRWQVMNKRPLIICDTGHNKEGLEYTLRQINRIPKSELHFVIGFVNDKDISSVLPMFPADAKYYFTRASVPRALNEKILRSMAKESGLTGKCYPDVKAAIKAARNSASGDDLIYIGGSTFIVADALGKL
jgi:dihydrofolate synthase/folylpolyglutamate synthase